MSTHLPHLTRPQLTTLALWRCGIVLTQRTGLTTVRAFLALLRTHAETTVRERVRSW